MRFFLFIFFISVYISLFSEEKKPVSYDTGSAIVLKKALPEKEREIFADKEFIYDKNIKPSNNWLELFWEWLTKLVGKPFQKSPKTSYNAIKYFFVILFIFGIIFVLYKTTFSKALSKNAKKISPSAFSDLPDDLENVTINTLIQQAIQDKNYRLVVRWCFLRVLQVLNRQNKISWKPSKTNRDYRYELKEKDLKENFIKLSYVFEYVWYGEVEIDEAKSVDYKNKVEKFIQNAEGK